MSDQSYDSCDTRNKIRFSSKYTSPHSNGSIDARRRDFVHPYAHQPTPAEKLHEICTNFGETSMFISYEVVVWILDKLWGLLINVLLLPIAILGLTLDYLRHQARRVSKIHSKIAYHPSSSRFTLTNLNFWLSQTIVPSPSKPVTPDPQSAHQGAKQEAKLADRARSGPHASLLHQQEARLNVRWHACWSDTWLHHCSCKYTQALEKSKNKRWLLPSCYNLNLGIAINRSIIS